MKPKYFKSIRSLVINGLRIAIATERDFILAYLPEPTDSKDELGKDELRAVEKSEAAIRDWTEYIKWKAT